MPRPVPAPGFRGGRGPRAAMWGGIGDKPADAALPQATPAATTHTAAGIPAARAPGGGRPGGGWPACPGPGRGSSLGQAGGRPDGAARRGDLFRTGRQHVYRPGVTMIPPGDHVPPARAGGPGPGPCPGVTRRSRPGWPTRIQRALPGGRGPGWRAGQADRARHGQPGDAPDSLRADLAGLQADLARGAGHPRRLLPRRAGITTNDQGRAGPGPWTRTAPCGTGMQRTLARLSAWLLVGPDAACRPPIRRPGHQHRHGRDHRNSRDLARRAPVRPPHR